MLEGVQVRLQADHQGHPLLPGGVRVEVSQQVSDPAAAVGLATHTGIFGDRVIGMVNINWDFMGVVKVGETIHSRVTVEEIRPTSKPGRDLATYAFEVLNQRDEIIQRGRMKVIVRAD